MPDPMSVDKVSSPILRHILLPRKKVLKQLSEGVQNGYSRSEAAILEAMEFLQYLQPHQLLCSVSSDPKIGALARLTGHLANPTVHSLQGNKGTHKCILQLNPDKAN